MGTYFFKHGSGSQPVFQVKRKFLEGSIVSIDYSFSFHLQDHKERVNALCHFGKYLQTVNVGRVS